jgi:U3 small nucleolar RNA-associated protein 24
MASSMFLQHNTALVPPYRVLIDTNFINFSLQSKLELVSGMMDCLYAKCWLNPLRDHTVFVGTLTIAIGIPCVTDCVMAELEKLGQRYRVALR